LAGFCPVPFTVQIFNAYSFRFQFLYIFFPHGVTAPSGPGPPHCRGFTITLRHTKFGRTPLDKCTARLYLTTHSTHKQQTSVAPAVFELTIAANDRPQTHL
jgi:hypothetical protein